MATEIAKAYVQIVPSMKGVKGQIENELGGAGDGAGKKAGNGFLSGMGGVIKGGAKALGAGVAAAATGLSKIVADSVSGFADYEQLTGGIETMFKQTSKSYDELVKEGIAAGKSLSEINMDWLSDASFTVMRNANRAYETAGLSANEYMETVTSFSASLISSLAGDKAEAAKYADMAITDMADNANKMGSSMESIQNAYQGFAKQNYTMLDNLKLGYGGTKEEMARLLADAEKISGIEYDISSYADIVDAIHVVQTEMGITGTTALEASTTISGSVASMKAAWQNLVTDLANGDADIGASIDALMSTVLGENGVGGVINNITPVIEQALAGIGALVAGLAPIISGVLPNLIADVLPNLLNAASELVVGLVDGIVVNLPMLMDTALDVVMALCNGLVENADKLIDGVTAMVMSIIDFTINNFGKIVDLGIQLIAALGEGLVKAIPQLIVKIPLIYKSVYTTLIEAVPQLWDVGKQMVEGIWQGIKNAKDAFVANVKSFFSGIIASVKSVLGIASPSKVFRDQIGKQMAAGIGVGFSNEIGAVQREIAGDVDGMISSVSGATVRMNANVNAAGGGFDAASLDRLVAAIGDTAAHIHVYLDSKEIKAGQQRLARAVG